MLRDVFAECVRVLEPGGRIAVNVANLGRKPYRSLSAEVITILQDELGLLLRGEVLWVKGKGANGSCAWGSYASSANPVLRDVSERIIVASKGRFDRAVSKKDRSIRGLPYEDTISPEDFRSWTLDTWYFSARVGEAGRAPRTLSRRAATQGDRAEHLPRGLRPGSVCRGISNESRLPGDRLALHRRGHRSGVHRSRRASNRRVFEDDV